MSTTQFSKTTASMDAFYLSLAQTLKTILLQIYSVNRTVEALVGDFSTPPKIELGHVAFPCFTLAKETGQKPPEISQTLALELNKRPEIAEAKSVGPYLNIFFKPEYLANTIIEPIEDGSFFGRPSLSMGPVMVEYSQPNTHKELHVGHMRNLCFGLALVETLKYSGRPVIATTFPGDVGTHVAKCLWYLKYHNQQPAPEHNKGVWLGKMYSMAHNKLEDELGTPQEEKNREQLTQILQQLEKKSGEFYELWQTTRQWSIDLMQTIYQWAGVKFDHWYWESDVDSPSVQLVKSLLEKGQLQVSEGAVGMDLTAENLGFCLLLKSDGTGLYATKDLELVRRKFENFNPSQCIVVVDLRQELHFKQVFTVFKKLGFAEQAEKCFHLKYNFVELPDGAMSSRKGNIVPITQLIEQMKAHVSETYLSRYRGEWSEDEIARTSDMVAQGAIKYGMNIMDLNKKIVFKMEDWLKLDGESGPYIQYTHARICSLLSKFPLDSGVAPDFSGLSENVELALQLKLAEFNKVVETCAQGLRTAPLCAYLYDTAKLFNSFYHDCPIGKLEDAGLRQARLHLAQATQKVISKGLSLLAIPAPQRM